MSAVDQSGENSRSGMACFGSGSILWSADTNSQLQSFTLEVSVFVDDAPP